MDFKIFLIVLAFVNPAEQEAFDYYVEGVRKQYEAVGAKRIKYPNIQTVMGTNNPDFIMVVEFPNQQALQKLFTSPEYQQLAPYREKAFKELKVFLSKEEDAKD